MVNENTGSGLLEILIDKATKKAYRNANDWMESDVSISSQLRDGTRTARNAFYEIEDQTEDAEILLNLMQNKLQKVLEYYQQLPGDFGQWECSALNIIRNEIHRMITEKYNPTDDELKITE